LPRFCEICEPFSFAHLPKNSGTSVIKSSNINVGICKEYSEFNQIWCITSDLHCDTMNSSQMAEARTGCIYLLTCDINGKAYVGQSLDFKNRMNGHKNSAKKPKQYFSYAIRKHGWENFTKEILIDDVPKDELNDLEIHYIAVKNTFGPGGYNLTAGGGGLSGFYNPVNHSVEGGGCIWHSRETNKWHVLGSRAAGKKYIGQYLSKEKAIAALTLYNETGICMPSDNTNRRAGTGGITERNGRFRCRYNQKDVGTFSSEEEANKAFIAYKQHGTTFKRKRELGTGSIQERISKKGKRFRGRFKGKNTKTYDSRDLVQIALNKLISENQ